MSPITSTERTRCRAAVFGVLFIAALGVAAQAQRPSTTVHFHNTTQGPFWPPSAVTNVDGHFLVVGNLITEFAPGVIFPMPGAALVSKETVPPLGATGSEDFSNPFGAPYQVIRRLDLSPGSPDLRMVLHSNSFGPVVGAFGGGPRIPRLGESAYNLNGEDIGCSEVFPSASQMDFQRPSFPLHRVPILGLRGDQLARDAETGLAARREELALDQWPRDHAITLGDWLKGRAQVRITLRGWSEEAQGYTAARFEVRARRLIPNAIYTVNFLRTNGLQPRPQQRGPDPIALPNLLITDETGRGKLDRVVNNPFPNPAQDPRGLRVLSIVLGFRSDYTNWGGCASSFGAGVNVHAALTTGIDPEDEAASLTDFITVDAP